MKLKLTLFLIILNHLQLLHGSDNLQLALPNEGQIQQPPAWQMKLFKAGLFCVDTTPLLATVTGGTTLFSF